MPLYEYECRACGAITEQLQRRDDAPPTACASCGGELVRVVTSRFGIDMKGSGGGSETGGCSLERTGHTCCGRSHRCDKPGCGR